MTGFKVAMYLILVGLLGLSMCIGHWFGMWPVMALWSVVIIIAGCIGVSVELEDR